MSETIEFEAVMTARFSAGSPLTSLDVGLTITKSDYSGGELSDIFPAGTRCIVTLAPVEPEPEPATLPSWDDAPEWAQWMARNADGRSSWYQNKPHISTWGDRWFAYASETRHCGGAVVDPNWRDTLQQRPKPEPELKPCPRCGGEMYLVPGEFDMYRSTRCHQCRVYGPQCNTRTEAIEAHNARKCPELDPCPHCGGEWRLDRSKKLYSARCRGCDHRTRKHTTLLGLVADINRRA